jgi:hypothetical protein
LRGEVLWLLRPAGDVTAITCIWRVELAKPWMRWFSPLLASVLRWHHDGVMQAGAIGLARYLTAGEGGASGPAGR